MLLALGLEGYRSPGPDLSRGLEAHRMQRVVPVQGLRPLGVGAVHLDETLAEIESDTLQGRTLRHGMFLRSRIRAR